MFEVCMNGGFKLRFHMKGRSKKNVSNMAENNPRLEIEKKKRMV